MKKIQTVVSAIIIGLSFSIPAHAQWAVFDAGNYAQAIQQVQAWQKQIKGMKDQFDQNKRQFDAMNGSRGMGQLVNDPQLRGYLPNNYQAILESGYGASTAIRNKHSVNAVTETGLKAASDAAKLYEQSGRQAAINRATAEEGYKQASNRFASIQVLLDRVNNAPDPKAIADLQARIQAEQAMLQNETIKLQMMGQLAQAQRDIQMQQAMEVRAKSTRGEVPRF